MIALKPWLQEYFQQQRTADAGAAPSQAVAEAKPYDRTRTPTPRVRFSVLAQAAVSRPWLTAALHCLLVQEAAYLLALGAATGVCSGMLGIGAGSMVVVGLAVRCDYRSFCTAFPWAIPA